MSIEKQIPRADEAERAVIGSILIGQNVDDCDIAPEDFYDPGHACLMSLFRRLQAAGEKIDPVLVVGKLRESGKFDFVGGSVGLKRLGEGTPYSANLRHYAQQVREAAIKRRVIYAADEISRAGFESETASEAVERAERTVFELAEHGTSDREPRPASDFINSTLEELDARIRGDATTLSTGLVDLDQHSGGMNAGELIILAGRTAMGKTALAVNIAANVADSGKPVLFCSLEMSAVEIGARLISAAAEVDGAKIQAGKLSESQRSRIVKSAKQIAGAPLTIDDAPARTVSAIASIARRHKRRNGLELLVVDYLQLVSSEGRRESRVVEVGEITRRLKALSGELRVPVLVLSQLNRATESNQGRRPMLSNLRESGSIEQDANQVWFCHRAGYYDDSKPGSDAEIIVAKRRSGPPGVANVHWDGRYTRFRNRALKRQQEAAAFRDADGATFHDFSNSFS